MLKTYRKTLVQRLLRKIKWLEEKANKDLLNNDKSLKSSCSSIVAEDSLFKLIAENTSDGIMIADANSTIVFVSGAYTKQLGYSADEEIGRKADDIYNLVHPEDRDAVFADVYSAIKLKKPELTYRFRAKHKDGHYIWREDHTKFNYDDKGNFLNSYVISRDITERLELNEQIYTLSKVVNNAPISILITDDKGKIQFANPYFSAVTGYSSDEIMNNKPSILKSNFHPDEYYSKLWETISSGKSWEGVFCNMRKDKSLYWERSIIFPVKDRNDLITNYIAIKTDISKQKEFENLLSQRQHEIEAINENVPVISWRYSLDSGNNIVTEYVSNYAEILLELPKGAIDNNFYHFLEYVLPEYKQGLLEVMRNRFNNPKVNLSYEYQIATAQNNIRWLSSSGFSIYEGNQLICYGSTIDITERKQLEESLLKANFRMQVAADSAGIGIWEYQKATNTLIWDDWMFRLYGLTKEEFEGSIESWKRNIHVDDIDFALKQVKLAFDGEKEFDTEFRVNHPDGSWHILKAYAKVLRNADGQPEDMIGVNYDITNVKKHEKELKQLNENLESIVDARTKQLESVLNELMLENNQKNEALEQLSAANAAKHKYVSILAHDLKNPLTAINTSTELLKIFLQRRDFEKLSKHIERINQSTSQIVSLIDVVLLWNRSQTDTIKFKPETIPLSNLINNVLKFTSLSISQKDIQVNLSSPEDIKVYADREMLETIFRNIITNAVKFCNQGGNIEIKSEANGDEVLVAIADNGIGIAESRIPEIFTLTSNDSTPGTDGEKGSGLGLPLCKEFIERHHGKIWVTSSLEKGSTFYFTLPTTTVLP